MVRPSGAWTGPILAAALVGFVVSVLVYAAVWAPPSRAPEGPVVNGPPPGLIEFGSPSTTYLGDRTLYAFNLTDVRSNVTWNEIVFTVRPGPLTGSQTNWTLRVTNSTSGEYYPFLSVEGNWTTGSVDPPRLGEAVLLTVDSPLVEGALEATWPSLGAGNWTAQID